MRRRLLPDFTLKSTLRCHHGDEVVVVAMSSQVVAAAAVNDDFLRGQQIAAAEWVVLFEAKKNS
jgi:hypothetical protein